MEGVAELYDSPEQKQEQAIASHRAEAEQIERCYNRVFKSEDGQVVLKDIKNQCFIDTSTFVPGCTDAMLINEGCRRVFLRIMEMTRMDVSNMYLNRDTMPGQQPKKRIPKVEIE